MSREKADIAVRLATDKAYQSLLKRLDDLDRQTHSSRYVSLNFDRMVELLQLRDRVQAELEERRATLERETVSVARSTTRLTKPFGIRSLRVLRVIFSKKSIERVFAPIVADTQHEHFEALAAEESRLHRFCILARGYLSLLLAAVPHAFWHFLQKIVSGALGK